MYWLTEDTTIVCQHELGHVGIRPTQTFVTIAGRRVLVSPNPQGRPITGCPNVGATIKPCTQTLAVRHGYSDWLRIEGQSICLDTLRGLTDGTPPGTVDYEVRHPGQILVSEVP